jgi:hypothetical protein
MKIRITEEEKQNIIGLHSVNYLKKKQVVSEQFDANTGRYVTQYLQKLIGVQNSIIGKVVDVPKGTPVWHDYDKQNDNKIYLGNLGVYYDCSFNGYEYIFTDIKTLGNWKNESLSKQIRFYFCDGKKIKTWEQLTKGSNQDPNNIVTTCTPANATYNTSESLWDYAKVGNCYYTKKSTETKWIDLQLPKNVNSLNAVKKIKFPETTWCGAGEKAPNDTNTEPCPTKENEIPTTPTTPVTPTTPTTPVTPATNTTTNTASTLKQFPELIFGDKTK